MQRERRRDAETGTADTDNRNAWEIFDCFELVQTNEKTVEQTETELKNLEERLRSWYSRLKKAQSWKKKQEKRIERKTVCTVGYLSGLVRL